QESCCETLMATTLRAFARTDLTRHDALRARVVQRLQSQIAAMHDHVVSLGRKTAQERVCALFVRLHDLPALDVTSPGAITLPMSRTQRPGYPGLPLETVCPTIGAPPPRRVIGGGNKKGETRVPKPETLRDPRASCM